MNDLVKRYEFRMVDASVVSHFDIDQYSNLPVRKWPFIEDAIATGDIINIYGHLCNAIQACEERGLFLHALGGLRLLSRITNGRLVDNDRITRLEEDFSSIKLECGYELYFNSPEPNATSSAERPMYEDVYFEYDRRANGQGAIQNASFCLMHKKAGVALIASASITGTNGIVGRSGTPVLPVISENGHTGLCNALAEALPLCQIIFGASDILIAELDKEKISLYRRLVRKRSLFSAELYAYPYVDLSKSEHLIRCDIRKSSRSLVNWGEKNLKAVDLSGDRLTPALVDVIYNVLCKYHAEQIAKQGYDYMPRQSFDYTIELCRSNRGEISLAIDANDIIVGACVVIFENDNVAYYKEGAYDHDVQGKSPAYFLLFHSIMRAKSRGFRKFLPNRPLQAPISYSGNNKIQWESWRFGNSDFKDGFSSTVATELVYRHERCDRVTIPTC